LYQFLFELEYNLCKEYPALTPFEIEDTSFFEIIDLFAETRAMQIRLKEITDPNYEQVIRRPAGDDWF
jgi:hypothetical protein